MKKLLFGITSLTLGGAERVLVDIVNQLQKEYEITILTLYPQGEFEKTVSENVTIKSLYSKPYGEMSHFEKIKVSLALLFFKKRMYQKKVKGEYDTEIAFLEGPITRLFSVSNHEVKKIAWIHNDIAKVFGKGVVSILKRHYDKKQYGGYRNLIFVSQDNLGKFKQTYPGISSDRMQVIYNYLDEESVLKKAEQEIEDCFKKDRVSIVTVTRLVEQKAIQRLAQVHAKLIQDGIKHTIYVIGEGPEKEAVQKCIQELGIEDTFILLGKKENPYPYMKKADVFCLCSEYEGYPMVLLEAKVLQKYIVITDTAAREVVKGYSNSKVVPNDEQGMYDGLKEAIQKEKSKEIRQENTTQEILEQIREVVGEVK